MSWDKLKNHNYMIYYIYVSCKIWYDAPFRRYNQDVTLIGPWKFIQGQMAWGKQGHKVNWNIIYDFVYVLHTNISHSMHRFWDIGLNR